MSISSTVATVTKAYHQQFINSGDLNLVFDAPKITELSCLQLAAMGNSVDPTTVSKEVQKYISSGAYKRSSSDDLFFYLIILGFGIGLYYLLRKKKMA